MRVSLALTKRTNKRVPLNIIKWIHYNSTIRSMIRYRLIWFSGTRFHVSCGDFIIMTGYQNTSRRNGNLFGNADEYFSQVIQYKITSFVAYSTTRSSLLESLVNSSPPWEDGRHLDRRHFQMHFLEWKWNNYDSNVIETCPNESNWQYASIGSGNRLAPIRPQAIIWTNADPIHWRIYATLGRGVESGWEATKIITSVLDVVD